MGQKQYKENQKQVNDIVDKCLIELEPLGIWIYHRAVNTSSVYLKFKDPRIRSLTVRDHKTKPKYRYKWNIVLGYQGNKRVVDNGIVRYMYNENQLDAIFSHIKNYANKIKQNNPEERNV